MIRRLDLNLTQELASAIMADQRIRRSIREHMLRCLILSVSLFIMSLGIALSTKANLGVSPISCTPYVLSLAVPLTMGTLTILMHLGFVGVQAILLKKQFHPTLLLQIPIAFLFGILTDISLWLTAPLEVNGYAGAMTLCLLSCVVIGFGVYLQVKADSILLAGEGMSLAFVKTFHWEFGTVKTGMDCSLVFIGLVGSLLFLPELTGIREGTIIAAVLVGMIVRFFNQHLHWPDKLIERLLRTNDLQPEATDYAPDEPLDISPDSDYSPDSTSMGEQLLTSED